MNRSQSPVLRPLSIAAALVTAAVVGAAQGPPPGYYDSVDTSDPIAMRTTLNAVIDDHQRFPYTSGATDTWDILEAAQIDPGVAGNVLDVYQNDSHPAQGGGNSFYNREHTWPKSYGFPDDGGTNYPYTDCHMLYLCDPGYNSSRSNKPFRDCTAACIEEPTLFNAGTGQGGGMGSFPGNSNWTSGSFTQGTWQVWSGRQGDVARALLYADVRYEGGVHGITGWSEPDLILTDSESLIGSSNTGSNESVGYMGMLSVLIQWHNQDPVDALEMFRNDVVFSFQGNRNPFVDNPDWVACLFEGNCTGGPPNDPPSGDPWINELHYDNSGTDVGEAVEIAGPAGLSLAGYSVVGYNGNGGGSYGSINLSGVLPDFGACIGALAFDFAGLQNGSPDGLALVDPQGGVVQFLSYEGSFTATSGPAAGTTSIDIGVIETSGTPVGWSLQLGGAGNDYADFSWQAAQGETPDAVNAGQTFEDGCPLVAYCTAGTSASGCQALLSASGAASASAPSGFVVTASGVEGAKDGLFFFGTNGRQANPWGNGTSFQCVVPPVLRGGLLQGGGTAGACDGSLSQDLNALWCPACPKPSKNPGAGALVQVQAWYRDPLSTSNQTTSLSDAGEFSVAP